MDTSLLPLGSPLTFIIMVEAAEEGGGAELVEDTEEVLADIIFTVDTSADLSEPSDELQSASMHSDASSGSDPDPHPEEEDDEEQENEEEEGGQTEELLDLSIFPSTRTLLQLGLLSVLHGEPDDHEEGSYCESKPACSRPV